jgi:hypothetical protein
MRSQPLPTVRAHALAVALATFLSAAPAAPADDGFLDEALLRARQQEYLDHATEVFEPQSLLQVIAHLEQEERVPGFTVAPGSIPDTAWDAIFEKLRTLRDTSDFDVLYLLNLVYAHGGHPAASPALWEKADRALLSFKYWFTDPTPMRTLPGGAPVIDDMWYWSENHVLIFRTNELLAGKRFPDEVFEVSGLTGAEHAARARTAILAWLAERSRWGFTEWHSNVYYNLDMLPLLTLIEWSEDPEIVAAAEKVLDLLWLDVALHLHRGTFGATHGRSYIKDKASADTEDTFPASKMLFDDTALPYTSRGSSSATLFARADRYRLPEVIRRIARSHQTHWGRQRMNLPLPEEPPADAQAPLPPPPHGLTYGEEFLTLWWSMAAQPAWPILPVTLEVGERYDLWAGQFSPFKPLRDLVYVAGDPVTTLERALFFYRIVWQAITQSVLKEVNTVVYRTPDYMLSTAQDYRKGLRGQQTHTWQATLSERALVFTTHPASLPVPEGQPIPPGWNWQREDEPGPGYWTGEASQPRAAQFENVAIAIYAPQYASGTPLALDGFRYREETHAYFPQAHFDEVVQTGHWTFGREGSGYVALYSHRPTTWRIGQPEVFQNGDLPFDLVAEGGAQNVWIVECGDQARWGSFAAFRTAVAGAEVAVTPIPDRDGNSFADGFDVAYASPSQGLVSFGWHAPLVVDGIEIALADYPRFDNRYVQTPFDSRRYEVSDGKYSLLLDFDEDLRLAAPEAAAAAQLGVAAVALAALARRRRRPAA